MIQEVKVEGRKKYYQITVHGRMMLQEEYRRLETLVEEGREYMKGGSL